MAAALHAPRAEISLLEKDFSRQCQACSRGESWHPTECISDPVVCSHLFYSFPDDVP